MKITEDLESLLTRWEKTPNVMVPLAKATHTTDIIAGWIRAALGDARAQEAGEVAWPTDGELLQLMEASGYNASLVHPHCYQTFGWKTFADKLKSIAAKTAFPVPPAAGLALSPECSVQVMQTSAGADYFVAVKVGDRELTPYVFKERYKAEYETAMYRWLLNGSEKPDLMAYGPDGWPTAILALSRPAAGAGIAEAKDVASHGCKRSGGFVDSNCMADCDCHVTQHLSTDAGIAAPLAGDHSLLALAVAAPDAYLVIANEALDRAVVPHRFRRFNKDEAAIALAARAAPPAASADAAERVARIATLSRVIDDTFEALSVTDNEAALVEIERLKALTAPVAGDVAAENERLREALKQIDGLLDAVWNTDDRPAEVDGLVKIMRAVRAALTSTKGGTVSRQDGKTATDGAA